MARIDATFAQMPFCCGLGIVGGFTSWESSYTAALEIHARERDTALIATTIAEQKAAIKELKACGFTALRKFKGNEGNMITLWYLAPKRKR